MTMNQAELATVSRGQVGWAQVCATQSELREAVAAPRDTNNGKAVETEAEPTERREKPPSHRETNWPLSG